jgi:hypothetical protein
MGPILTLTTDPSPPFTTYVWSVASSFSSLSFLFDVNENIIENSIQFQIEVQICAQKELSNTGGEATVRGYSTTFELKTSNVKKNILLGLDAKIAAILLGMFLLIFLLYEKLLKCEIWDIFGFSVFCFDLFCLMMIYCFIFLYRLIFILAKRCVSDCGRLISNLIPNFSSSFSSPSHPPHVRVLDSSASNFLQFFECNNEHFEMPLFRMFIELLFHTRRGPLFGMFVFNLF